MKAKGSNLARDVYRDLRDRRLLSIAIVLVAAIVAVPFLVKSDADPQRPAPAAAVTSAGKTEALDSVVVPAAAELRDYRRRLDSFQEKNPFKQQLTAPVGGATLTDTSTSDSGSSSTESSISTDPVESTSPTDTSSTESDSADPSESDSADPSTEPVEDPGTVLYTTSIDVRVGPVGDTEVQRKIGELEFLPDSSAPIVQHLYADLDLSGAAFVVSPAVVDSEGDGRCEPTPQACQFLLLDVGEEQRFVYDDGVTYRLQLLKVNLHDKLYEDGQLPVGPDAKERSGDFVAGREPGDLTAG